MGRELIICGSIVAAFLLFVGGNLIQLTLHDCEDYKYHETAVLWPFKETECIKYTDEGVIRTPVSRAEWEYNRKASLIRLDDRRIRFRHGKGRRG